MVKINAKNVIQNVKDVLEEEKWIVNLAHKDIYSMQAKANVQDNAT